VIYHIVGQSNFYSPAEIHETLRKCTLNFAEKLNLEYFIADQSGKSISLQTPVNFRDASYFVDYTNLQEGLTAIYLSLFGRDGSTNHMALNLAKCVAQILHLPELSANSPSLDQLLACESPSRIPLLLIGLEKLSGDCGSCSLEVNFTFLFFSSPFFQVCKIIFLFFCFLVSFEIMPLYTQNRPLISHNA
jgi:hypothetical protein